MNFKAIFITLLSVSLFGGIFLYLLYPQAEVNPDDIAVFQLGDNKTLQVKIGQEIGIPLPQNSTTGYQQCFLNQKQMKCLQLSGTDYRQNEAPEDAVGVGGTLIFRFTAKELGTDTLKFANCPTAQMNKTCAYFADSTAQQAEYVFTVVVSK